MYTQTVLFEFRNQKYLLLVPGLSNFLFALPGYHGYYSVKPPQRPPLHTIIFTTYIHVQIVHVTCTCR